MLLLSYCHSLSFWCTPHPPSCLVHITNTLSLWRATWKVSDVLEAPALHCRVPVQQQILPSFFTYLFVPSANLTSLDQSIKAVDALYVYLRKQNKLLYVYLYLHSIVMLLTFPIPTGKPKCCHTQFKSSGGQ